MEQRSSLLRKIWSYLCFERIPSAVPELDGLRGVAILLVLMYHCVANHYSSMAVVRSVAELPFGSFVLNGWAGVQLFFVLSGYLLARNCLTRYAVPMSASDFVHYWSQRALRIMPGYYVALLAAYLLFPGKPESLTPAAVAAHLVFLQDYLPSAAQIVPSFWSVAVEEKFYLLLPFLLALLSLLRSVGLRLGVLLGLIGVGFFSRALEIATYWHNADYKSYVFRNCLFFHVNVDGLLVGVLCAYVSVYAMRSEILKRRESTIGNAAFWLGGIGALALLAFPFSSEPRSMFAAAGLYSAFTFCFGSLLLGLVHGNSAAKRVFRLSVLFFLGQIAYSTYLVHQPLIAWAHALVQAIPGIPISWRGPVGLLAPIYLALSILVGLFFFYAVEKPSLLLKQRFAPSKPKVLAPKNASVSASAAPASAVTG